MATPRETSEPMAVAASSSTNVIPDRLAFLINVILKTISRNQGVHVPAPDDPPGKPLNIDGDQPQIIAVTFSEWRRGDCHRSRVSDADGGLCTGIKCINEICGDKCGSGELIPIVEANRFHFLLQKLG